MKKMYLLFRKLGLDYMSIVRWLVAKLCVFDTIVAF